MRTIEEIGKDLAYPNKEFHEYNGSPYNSHRGISKREYFAGCALAGIDISNMDKKYEDIAEFAVLTADAVLKELNKGNDWQDADGDRDSSV